MFESWVIPVQLTPFPVKPGLQAHVNDPGMLVQFAFVSQSFNVEFAHSLTSKKKFDFSIQSYYSDIVEIVGGRMSKETNLSPFTIDH